MKQLARWISILAHPFAVSLVVVLDAAVRYGKGSAMKSVLLVAGLAIVPVAALIAWQVGRGRWADVDASHREQRPMLFLVGCAAVAALVLWLLLRDPHSFLLRGTLAVLGLLFVSSLVNRRIKVSLHSAFAAFGATVLLIAGSPTGWLLAATVPPLVWSRLALGRHRPVEVAVGLLIGVAAGAAAHLAPLSL